MQASDLIRRSTALRYDPVEPPRVADNRDRVASSRCYFFSSSKTDFATAAAVTAVGHPE
jgi:hypothetical protein